MAALVEVRNLVKQFPIKNSRQVVSAVNDVSFTIERGETLGLVGESGSGKTTVGRCLLRLTDPTSGTIRIAGQDLMALSPRDLHAFRARMQMVFQEPFHSLNPRMTAHATLAEPLRLQKRWTAREIDRQVREIAARVRLEEEHLPKYPYQLSSGQQQRVGIARAMITNPEFVVLDEPTSAVDLSVRADLIDLLMSLQRERGLTYLFISHDLSTVENICHHVGVMYLGRIVEFGTVDQVFNRPQHPYARALLSSVLAPDPALRRVRYVFRGEIPSPINLPKGCFLASRCPEARPRCSAEPQPLVDLGAGHEVACWRVASGDIPGWSTAWRSHVVAGRHPDAEAAAVAASTEGGHDTPLPLPPRESEPRAGS